MIYAEVIGDPVAHSKSPLIHKHWLAQLRLEGDYRRTRVAAGGLAAYLSGRRADPDWRGCNVTIPHKEQAAKLVDQIDETRAIGAVNCVFPQDGRLVGTNTDVEGIAAALDHVLIEGRPIALIGAGGAARATMAYLARRRPERVTLLVRDPKKAASLGQVAPMLPLEIGELSSAEAHLEGASLIINASPLGMAGCPELPANILDAVSHSPGGVTLFDMVYQPLSTAFLAAGRAAGAQVVDGLTMLVGQAARAFELFFGVAPPAPDRNLRDLLLRAG